MRYFEAAIDYSLEATQNARLHTRNGHEQRDQWVSEINVVHELKGDHQKS